MKTFVFILIFALSTTNAFAKTRKASLVDAHVIDQLCEDVCVLYVEENQTGRILGLVTDDHFADVAELHAAIESQAQIHLSLNNLKIVDQESSALLPQGPAEINFEFQGRTLRELLN